MLTVSRQNSSCQEGWTICNGRGLIHHLLYPTTLYLFYLKVLFINQFPFYWRGNLSFFIMCHYTTPFAAITALIRPQVYPQTQTLEQTGAEMCSHTDAHTYTIIAQGSVVLDRPHLTWVSWVGSGAGKEGKGWEAEVRMGRGRRIDNEGREWPEGGGGQESIKSLELRKTSPCLVISYECLYHLPELERRWAQKGETRKKAEPVERGQVLTTKRNILASEKNHRCSQGKM